MPVLNKPKLLKDITRVCGKWLKHSSSRSAANSPVPHTSLPVDIANTVRYFSSAGPFFENREIPTQQRPKTRVKAVAFYLPQFHAFAENDAWWGNGFTEWRNVARGLPRYQGHYQPRIPRDLGFYDLNRPEVLEAQSELASSAGISAFCFYYYWFNGQRLMQKPLDLFCKLDTQQEFCLMWANENWTRRWDGRDNDVLIAQHYERSQEEGFLTDTATYFQHPRYLRIDGRPVFTIYRASEIPNTVETLDRWRARWRELIGVEPLVFMAQSYNDRDPTVFACDAAVEFPPHKVSKDLQRQNKHYQLFDPNFSGQIRAYEEVIAKSLGETTPDYPLVKTVSPSWDNDARRVGAGVSFQGSTPELYESWLAGAIRHAEKYPVCDQSLVFINAWNEWAEAAYLEPDVFYGHAYINKTYYQLLERRKHYGAPVLLVGHDAHRNGAQHLLLEITRYLVKKKHLSVHILLKEGGALLEDYRALAPTYLLNDLPDGDISQWLRTQQYQTALFNTVVTGDLVIAARKANIRCTALIHELPALIIERSLQSEVKSLAQHADHLFFASETVKNGFASFKYDIKGEVTIKPQGLYKPLHLIPGARERKRHALGLDSSSKLIINIGYADHRKGFDLFVSTANRLIQQHKNVHFCWVGKRHKSMSKWLKSNSNQALKGKLHLLDYTDDIAAWFGAADCFYLSSREDPYPSVVLEAMSLGLPIVLHDGATGFDSTVLNEAYVVDSQNPSSIEDQLVAAITRDTNDQRYRRMDIVKTHYRFEDYVDNVLATAEPMSELAPV